LISAPLQYNYDHKIGPPPSPIAAPVAADCPLRGHVTKV
jgi:hypothetical protein